MVANVANLPKLYIRHYRHGVISIFKNLWILAKILKTEGLGKNQNRIYETYKNTVMPHGHNIYAIEYHMDKATMCAYSQSNHALPHWKIFM